MARNSFSFKRFPVICLLIAAYSQLATCLDMKYCSPINTSGTPGNSSIYQSNGLCFDFCVGRYSFAILSSDECFCSNFAPSEPSDISDCDFNCPGYPDDRCGGLDVYGYFELRKRPSGTKDAEGNLVTRTKSDQQQSTSESSEPSIITTTELIPTTVFPPSTSSSAPPTTSSSSTSSTSTSDQTTSSTWTPTPMTSVRTVTGEVQVITFTPTAPPEREKKDDGGGGGGGFGTGAAVGLTIGLVALAAIIGAFIFFCMRKKRKEREENEKLRSGSSPDMAPTPARTLSESSRYMLGSDGRNVVGGWQPGMDQPGNRQSRLMPVDPRLDPFAPVYQRGDGAHSRESVQTIQDNHDYSRRVMPQGAPQGGLRVLNP